MLDYTSEFPGQVDTTDATNYPQGKAQNVTVSGDGTGTPWEKRVLNDIWGFFQRCVSVGGVTPNGLNETAVVSDVLEAIRNIKTRESTYSVTRFVGADFGISDAAATPTNGPAWFAANSSNVQCINTTTDQPGFYLPIDLVIPDGATITQVRVSVNPAASVATVNDRMQVQLRYADVSSGWATANIATSTDDGTAAEQWVTMSGLSHVVDKTTRSYSVKVFSSVTTPTPYDTFHGVEVTYTTNKNFID